MNIQEESQNWLNTSLKNADLASWAIQLSGLMIKHTKLIEQAIRGDLQGNDYQKIINWVVKQCPKTTDAQADSFVFETAWMIYDIAYRGTQERDEENVNQEANFLADLRSSFLEARINAR